MTRLICSIALMFSLIGPARADFRFSASDDVQRYIESNLLGIFYHELGHALIDILRLPVLAQEEDAADVLSVLLIDAFFEEEVAVDIAYDTAFGFLGEADHAGEPVFWDVHGPDLQRYYNLVCLFYGANPDERADVADDLGLPKGRAESCEEEFELAADSWAAVLEEIESEQSNLSFVIGEQSGEGPAAALILEVMNAEIDALNAEFELPELLKISVLDCGEANAWYDPERIEIVMCTEFVDHLVETRPNL